MKTNLLIFYKAKLTVYSEIHTKHANSMWLQCRIFECQNFLYVKLTVWFKQLRRRSWKWGTFLNFFIFLILALMNVGGQPQPQHFVNREEPWRTLNRKIVGLQSQSACLDSRRIPFHNTSSPASIYLTVSKFCVVIYLLLLSVNRIL